MAVESKEELAMMAICEIVCYGVPRKGEVLQPKRSDHAIWHKRKDVPAFLRATTAQWRKSFFVDISLVKPGLYRGSPSIVRPVARLIVQFVLLCLLSSKGSPLGSGSYFTKIGCYLARFSSFPDHVWFAAVAPDFPWMT